MDGAVLTAFAAGFALGFLVAAQIGPISLLCVRSVLRRRLLTGLSVGAGAALIDITYAALGVVGATQLLRVTQVRLALGLAGTVALLVIGARTLWSAFRIRNGLEASQETISPARALRTALIAGIGCGSFAWFAALSAVVAIAARRVGMRGLRLADAASGLGIMGLAACWAGAPSTRLSPAGAGFP